ncbi:MAG: hypothetical protein DHS20C11_10780 [Lysobacteraceae bacterium]|nr:MAG: hypothetical protein DHS20C11_10780 [Xanthomonadaceae bacterium]
MQVEVVFAMPDRQWRVSTEVPEGATIAQAIAASGIESMVGELEVSADNVGIYGRRLKPDATVEEGDRIEIYRPLLIDPKEERRLRAEAAKKA